MAYNDVYTLRNYYTTISQKVPLLLEYQFLVKFLFGEGDAEKDYPAFCNGSTLLCQSATIPKRSIEVTNVNFFAKKFQIPATLKYDHEWKTKMILTHDMAMYSELRKMMLSFSSLNNNGGGIRTVPNINIQVDILDQFSEKGAAVTDVPRFILVGAYPTDVGKLDLKYSEETQAMTFEVTWTYQYSYIDRIHDAGAIAGDPLAAGKVPPIE